MFHNLSRLFLRFPVLGSIFGVCLLLSAFPSQSAFAATTWSIVHTPNGKYSVNYLQSIAGSTSNDVWAVGNTGNVHNTSLIEHWNGKKWAVVNAPAVTIGGVAAVEDPLNGVAVVSSTDAWAVGTTRTSTGGNQALIEHWNGTQWSISPAPVPPAHITYYLNAVTAIASNDVWAVGYYYGYSASLDTTVTQALTLHWDGSSWTVFPTPVNMSGLSVTDDVFSSVVALASNNVWAVGSGGALIEHWDGTSWSVVNSPVPPTKSGYQLNSIATDGKGDLWAVGSYNFVTDRTLIERWDGTNWTIVSSPNPLVPSGPTHGNPEASDLNGVTVVSANSAWAVGEFEPAGATGGNMPRQTLVEHWDGTSWSIVPSPNVSAKDDTFLTAVTSLNGFTGAVGSSGTNTLAMGCACS